MVYYGNRDLIKKARELRNNMTTSEILLWSRLRSKQVEGYKFRRQQPIFDFIVDFYCHEIKFIIEVDGPVHSLPEQAVYDKRREKILKTNGYTIFHLSAAEIISNLEASVSRLKNFILTKMSPPGGTTGGTPIKTKQLSEDQPTISNPQSTNISPPGGTTGGSPTKTKQLSEDPPTSNNIHSTNMSPPGGTTGGSSIVYIGSIPLGGHFPIRIQSMTNTDTLDTRASVLQCIRIIEAGADMVRLTAQGTREAVNLANIKRELRKAGFETPLIADIHFNPAAAEAAARIVEKVRINPGNYADKRASFRTVDYTEQEYREELERIHSRLLPLINICHENKTAVRIGVNHGSLSDRIMTRYGNTPEGMAVSAMEFIRIFRTENFNNLVLSMKSSDTAVMVNATRTLVTMMMKEGYSYPIHLGVTEAGEGEDGRIRSAAGIGALLAEGIGDTVRVSLSEDPEKEIPVAREIIRCAGGKTGRISIPAKKLPFKTHESFYKPEVIGFEKGKFITENGDQYKGTILTFKAGSFPEIPADHSEKIMLNPVFKEDDPKKLAIDSATFLGRYFITRQADGICIINKGKVQGEKLKELAFSILQASEARITRTRYISCPTCGRTKFNLQDAVREVKAVTGHLTGLKIAVMGCIVNGPGEMAGSDYGYVGTADGKVHIYRGTVPVLKNIPQEKAAEKLVKLIEKDLG